MFKKKQKAVKILACAGCETATIVTIESVKKGVARCEGDEYLKYDAKTGEEIDPAMAFAGISSRLVTLEE